MTIYFINRYFYPDHSATSQMLSDLAFYLAQQEWDIHIITSRQCYDDPSANLPENETIKNITIHRIKTPTFGRGYLLGRALDYFGFYVNATRKMNTLVKKNDILIAKTDPPLISIPAAWVAKRKHAILINWLQDLFPEVAIALKVKGANGWFGQWLLKKRNQSLQAAKINVAIGKRMASLLRKNGIPDNKITIIPNWADGEAIYPVPKQDNPLIKQWELENKFIVGYSGNLGRAHEINTILGAAEQLKNNTDIVFLFIGGGANKKLLAEQAEKRQLNNILFKVYQPRDQLHNSLSVADVHLVVLNPELEGLIVPSKYYGIAAANKPCLFIGDKNGEIPSLLKSFGGGITIPPNHIDALADAIVQYQHKNNNNANIREYHNTQLDYNISVGKWVACINNLRK